MPDILRRKTLADWLNCAVHEVDELYDYREQLEAQLVLKVQAEIRKEQAENE